MDIAEIAGIKGQKHVFCTIYILYPAPDSSFIQFTFYILLPILLFYNFHFISCSRFFFYTIYNFISCSRFFFYKIYILYPAPDSSFLQFTFFILLPILLLYNLHSISYSRFFFYKLQGHPQNCGNEKRFLPFSFNSSLKIKHESVVQCTTDSFYLLNYNATATGKSDLLVTISNTHIIALLSSTYSTVLWVSLYNVYFSQNL